MQRDAVLRSTDNGSRKKLSVPRHKSSLNESATLMDYKRIFFNI